jgi:c-di-GMP-binding flagellar brake protein YcgR
MPERRRAERVRILGDLPGEVTIVQPLRVSDLSQGGAAVELARQLAIESLHEFRLVLGPRTVVAKGRVVYCRISNIAVDHVTYLAGIEFIDLSAHAREAIALYIGERPRGAG